MSFIYYNESSLYSMKFSIIVPIYNVESYLPQCIESVLCQSFKDYELILVDDGSPDGCPLLCDKYKEQESRVRVIHKRNGGLVSARKAGVEIATGDYCIALDGDDWLDDNALEKLSVIEKKYNPDLIRFGFTLSRSNFFKEVPIMAFRNGYYSRDEMERDLVPWLIYGKDGKCFPQSIWGSAIKRQLYYQEQMQVPDVISIGEDASVMNPIHFKAKNLYIMKDCLYFYRANDNSMTKNRKPFSLDNPQIRAEHQARRIDLTKFDLQAQLDRSTVHSLFNACVTQFWGSQPYVQIEEQILSSLNHDYYKIIIGRVKYEPLSRRLMSSIMKHKWVFMIWVISKFKRF